MNLVKACRLSSIAYMIDPAAQKDACAAIGAAWVGLWQDDPECQLMVVAGDGEMTVVVRGTPFFENTRVLAVLDNLRGLPLDVGGGCLVHNGYATPFLRVANGLPPDVRDFAGPVRVVGHSMGGARAGCGRLVWPRASVTQVAPPKSANAAFWARYHPGGEGIEWLVDEDDFAPGWPWVGPWAHPATPMYWLRRGQLVAIDHDRPGFNGSEAAHDVDLYASRTAAVYARPADLPTQLRTPLAEAAPA